ncbi:ArnT family glycosyltransferase [Tundrisphaera lichenicola]|uniref:ArnT family glycosyltransferase n=1 Tax=Tundrisphaera lichenicola TaxID=2029860 RepID=UPI003EBEEC4B
MEPAQPFNRALRETLGVAVVTVLGAALRLWPPGRFGLSHFDEGIYAMVGAWAQVPGGLAALDPMLIPYAPPGFPISIGLVSLLIGPTDLSAMAVSVMAGTLTIPLIAYLGRRIFGPGVGLTSAVFCALSGPHLAFSRIALTDASFLLAWLVAMVVSIRFLERPGPVRALGLGLSVGLAQQFKYNGWLTSGIVLGSAFLGILLRREDRRPAAMARVFGWGLVAAGVAWLVVWPWFRFVEDHGGYSALLRHQRSYLGGFETWWPHLKVQSEQAVALSGGRPLILFTLVMAGIARWRMSPPDDPPESTIRRVCTVCFGPLVAWVFLDAPYWLGLIMAPWLLDSREVGPRVLGVWWLILSVITPFYHPYARLWLPLEALNWILIGWLVVRGIPTIRAASRIFGRKGERPWFRHPPLIYVLATLAIGVYLTRTTASRAEILPGLLDPSDSLRRASAQVGARLPEDVAGLRLLVRPPVTYYLSGRIALYPMAGSDGLLIPSDPRLWALVDSTILRSEAGQTSDRSAVRLLARFADRWELVEEFPSTMTLPTLLDLDPAAARSASPDRSAPLWLLRPRRPGTAP